MKKYIKINKNKWLVIGYTKLPKGLKPFIRIKDDRKDLVSCW
jgi:hypothetical protein